MPAIALCCLRMSRALLLVLWLAGHAKWQKDQRLLQLPCHPANKQAPGDTTHVSGYVPSKVCWSCSHGCFYDTS